jgi:probable HAF family extracellular repeat protein
VGKGVNDRGEVTGDVLRFHDGKWQAFAWVYSNGVLTDLGPLGTSSRLGQGIVSGFDAQGRVLANRILEPAPGVEISEPTVWSRGPSGSWTGQALQHLGMGGVLSAGNARGPWVGSVATSPTQRVAAVWTTTGFRTLGSLGGSSHAQAANAKGDVVGYSYTSATGTERRAFLMRASTGKMLDLNTLIDPQLGWVLGGAVDINEEGVIVGQGLQHGQPRMFRLLPRAE